MQSEHLKPDEIAMLERAEKATKGPLTTRPCPAPNIALSKHDHGTVHMVEYDDGEFAGQTLLAIGEKSEANAKFAAAARTDLPTILVRLANERAKLAIAMDALESAWLAIRQGAEQETRNIIEDALARINELEK